MTRSRNEGPRPVPEVGAWEVVGNREQGGEIGHGLIVGTDGRARMRVSAPNAGADLDLGDAYRFALGIIAQLRAAGHLPGPDA